jgi:hypothetical protein
MIVLVGSIEYHLGEREVASLELAIGIVASFGLLIFMVHLYYCLMGCIFSDIIFLLVFM